VRGRRACLVGQLAGVAHDERADLAGGGLDVQLLEDGDDEDGGLAHPGLGLANDIHPQHRLRNALVLDCTSDTGRRGGEESGGASAEGGARGRREQERRPDSTGHRTRRWTEPANRPATSGSAAGEPPRRRRGNRQASGGTAGEWGTCRVRHQIRCNAAPAPRSPHLRRGARSRSPRWRAGSRASAGSP